MAEFSPKNGGRITWNWTSINNCGMIVMTGMGGNFGPDPDECLRELAEHLNTQAYDGVTCIYMSDNVVKKNEMQPTYSADSRTPRIGRFAAWLIKSRYGQIYLGPRTVNAIHFRPEDWSVIQGWTWIVPRGVAMAEEQKFIPKKFFKRLPWIFRTPKKTKKKSTDW